MNATWRNGGKNERTKSFDLNKLFEGSLRRLRVEADFFSRLTEHSPELGRLNETHLERLLRDYLPPKFGIGTGFIACGGPAPTQSPQCDIIVYDALNNAPLYKSEAWSIFPIEMVYGVIEVKTKLTTTALKEAFEKCGKIRAMAKTPNGGPNKAYIRQVTAKPKTPTQWEPIYGDLSPRFFIFSYGGWKDSKTLERNFIEVSDMGFGAHIHGVCCLSPEANNLLSVVLQASFLWDTMSVGTVSRNASDCRSLCP